MEAGRRYSVPPGGLPDVFSVHEATGSGPRWFYCIGALSLVHTVILALGSNLSVIGLGITATLAPGASIASAVILNCSLAGLFFLLGMFAQKRARWAVVVGVTVYAMDALLLLYTHIYLGAALHALLLCAIFAGLAPAPHRVVPTMTRGAAPSGKAE